MAQVQHEYRQALARSALAEAVGQVDQVLHHTKNHRDERPIRIVVGGQAPVQRFARAADHPTRCHGLDGEEVTLGRGQPDKIVREQEAQHLPAPVTPEAADHQHAVDDIENFLGRFAFVNQHVARLERPLRCLVEDVQEQVVCQLLRGHEPSIARR